MKIYQYIGFHIIIMCQRFHVIASFTFWDTRRTQDTWNFVYRHLETINILKVGYFFKKNRIYGKLTREFLGLRMRNFQSTVFTWIQPYSEIFKSAIWLENHKTDTNFGLYGINIWTSMFLTRCHRKNALP